MQPSEYEIQREVEALRDIKRRSTTPGALAIDPDLPNPTSASTSPTSAYWSGDGDSSSASHEDSSSSGHNSVTGGDDSAGDDPFHLFWVPASVHPEIAPAEFRAFLKEHARSPPPSEGSMSRTGSLSSLSSTSSGLGRKRSMLSRQYRPSENDGVGEHEETIVPLRRSGTSLYKHGPQLTISDLQRLEELAEEASESDDPSKLRSLLRRSLSMNMSPTAMGMDGIADIPEDVDAPIILPPSNQILRRANRTKIRKPGLPGDGGGHRFGASRRGATPRSGTTPVSFTEKRTSSDRSSSDHGDDASTAPNRRRTFDTDSQPRPESYSDEAFIFDAYVREEEESEEQHATPVVVTASPPSSSHIELPPIQTDSHTSLFEALEPVLHHPQPQRLVPPSPEQQTSRTPSPSSEPIISPSHSPEATPVPGTAVQRPPSPSYSPPPQSQTQAQRKEKDKKGLFGKWGADKGGKKGSAKEKEKESRDRAEKESKDSSFFGSLFGGKKHKESDGAHVAVHGGHSGREAAAALLGSSKSAKNYQPPPSPVGSPGVNNWSRYPIHVERAIYRLSHIKLANPRRPLYEQVLISNLMFWYLGVINKAQTPTSPPDGQTNAAGAGAGAQTGGPEESEAEEKDRLERERQEREKKESERLAREQKEKEAADAARKRESSPKRGPLTKPAPMNSGRRAEMPVKGPQYDVQHRVMEEEYTFGGGYNGSPQGRSKTPPSSKAYQQSQDSNGADYYRSSDQQRLPPGAMQPLEQSWSSPNPKPVSPPPSSIGNNNPRRSRSPPQPNQGYNSFDSGDRSGGGGRLPGRSLSATAAPSPSPPPSNGKIRKGHSAYAGVPSSQRSQRDPSEDEDVPLAVWQQQQRRR